MILAVVIGLGGLGVVLACYANRDELGARAGFSGALPYIVAAVACVIAAGAVGVMIDSGKGACGPENACHHAP